MDETLPHDHVIGSCKLILVALEANSGVMHKTVRCFPGEPC